MHAQAGVRPFSRQFAVCTYFLLMIQILPAFVYTQISLDVTDRSVNIARRVLVSAFGHSGEKSACWHVTSTCRCFAFATELPAVKLRLIEQACTCFTMHGDGGLIKL